jgi:hypothetical protein
MTKHKRPQPMPRWNTLASAHFGGDINRLKCTEADLDRPDQIKFQYATYTVWIDRAAQSGSLD